MTQIITKNGSVYCVTAVPYSDETLRQMRREGYRVKEVKK